MCSFGPYKISSKDVFRVPEDFNVLTVFNDGTSEFYPEAIISNLTFETMEGHDL